MWVGLGWANGPLAHGKWALRGENAVNKIQQDMMLRDLLSALDKAADDINSVVVDYEKKLHRSDLKALKRAADTIESVAEHISIERYRGTAPGP
jgi:hypothetical protein